ncbi:MAG TPA: hypothetical protein GXX39_02320 [Syntrophothermus lipocalidus]|nr:hypothetical protein [Syntrophothermus lipocalidus]
MNQRFSVDCPTAMVSSDRFNKKRGYGWETNSWVCIITFQGILGCGNCDYYEPDHLFGETGRGFCPICHKERPAHARCNWYKPVTKE